MKDVFQKAKISARQLLACLSAISVCGIFFLSFTVGASNDQVETVKFQVFLSFNGETRFGFTSHLYKGLTQAGYRTFIDEVMRRGENIKKELIMTIRASEASVLVISLGYASSQSCLDELVEIFRCKKLLGHKVLPIFYQVDPDDIDDQTSKFKVAFDGLVKCLKDPTDKRVNRWKKSLEEVTSIAGLVLRPYMNEADFIDRVVAEVRKLLPTAPQLVPFSVVVWYSFTHGFNSWLQLNHEITLLMIEELLPPASICWFLYAIELGLIVILLRITVSLYLRSVKRTDDLKNDRPSEKSSEIMASSKRQELEDPQESKEHSVPIPWFVSDGALSGKQLLNLLCFNFHHVLVYF